MRNDALWTLLLLTWMVGTTYYYVCHIRKHCCGGCQAMSDMTMAELTAPPSASLRVQGTQVDIASDQGVRFARDESIPVVAPRADSALHQLSDYLQAYPEEQLYIIGWHDNSEKNTTLLASLGRARAEAVKQHLVGLGVPEERVGTADRSSIDLLFGGDTLFNGLTLRVVSDLPPHSLAAQPDTLKMLEARLRGTSQQIYFETGATTLTMTDSLTRYLEDVQRYLEAYPQRSIVLTGHTDNVGRAASNMTYGQERADFTKTKLSELGIRPEQIKTRSEGELRPIASNQTSEGRSKNRRVEISIE
jgi:OOP family OmpA-OmpF porin